LRTLPPDNAQVRRFRTDERIIGTLVLSALAPEADTLRALTARRLAALNYGTIKVPIPGGESQLVEQRCRQWAAEVGEVKITGTGVDPALQPRSRTAPRPISARFEPVELLRGFNH